MLGIAEVKTNSSAMFSCGLLHRDKLVLADQLDVNTTCNLEDVSGAMDDRNGLSESRKSVLLSRR